MEDEDPFGMGAPPLSEPAAESEPPAMPAGDDFGMGGFDAPPAAPDMGSFDAPPPAAPTDSLPMFEDAPPAAMPMSMDGGMGDMGGGMGDMGGGMGGMGDMGGMGGMGGDAMPPMGGMGGGLGDEFSAPGELGPVAKWRIEQQEKVAAKATAAATAEAAKVAEAQEALAAFYADRQTTTQKRAQENRDAEAQYVQERDAAMIADSWDSVCKLVDLKEKAGQEVDTSRMRSLLTQLKHI